MNFKKIYEEDSNDITQNPSFISWFRGSKIVNPDGSPRIVYHGSNSKFDEFSYKNLGSRGRSEGVGIYFTDKKEEAMVYGKVLYEVYLSIKKPISFNAKMFTVSQTTFIVSKIVELEKRLNNIEKDMGLLSNYGDVNHEPFNTVVKECVESLLQNDTAIDFQSELVNIGVDPIVVNSAIYAITKYDGIISKGYNVGYDNILEGDMVIYIPFFPNQIKSINNNGKFSKSNNIYEDVDIKTVDLKALYNKYNKELFDGKLPDIPIKWSNTKSRGGYAKAIRYKTTGVITPTEIGISSYYIHKSMEGLLAILLHEMVHVYQHINGDSDAHGNGFTRKAKEITIKTGIPITINTDNSQLVVDPKKAKELDVILFKQVDIDNSVKYSMSVLKLGLISLNLEGFISQYKWKVKNDWEVYFVKSKDAELASYPISTKVSTMKYFRIDKNIFNRILEESEPILSLTKDYLELRGIA